ncbi:hypothetical protein A2950_02290 [Candidatus Kaiserbacteria bacterium RIFCSPLOWO2_01_FULL_55_19]|uniref:Uncharacterized protein n=1 Tax=Candidatus Kaiserbacteria bacterium RIFCSPLOWO2_01_FULL_55_19 TaxID=1798516 RepID=A0A1F6ERK8_9BACT|nr:MAG: hypothetical protein A2950_02290 [Candidatus Kaiserbacteria bacterium RIFCSPLOWO2_01_FULL_55_19]
MSKFRVHLPFSILSLSYATVGTLLVVYIGLIAVVMSYATLTIEFSQSVKRDEAVIAVLESEYLASVARITNTDYRAAGYAKPLTKTFVRARSVTASR